MAPADPPLVLDVVHEAGDWSAIGVPTLVAEIAARLPLRAPEAAGAATVVLADDATVRDLNRRFRGIDKATNVLSFPLGEDGSLGDVILARETLEREAAAERRPPGDHFAHLVVHGVLHLVGLDHQDETEADAMEALETTILADMGIPDPYAAEPIAETTTS